MQLLYNFLSRNEFYDGNIYWVHNTKYYEGQDNNLSAEDFFYIFIHPSNVAIYSSDRYTLFEKIPYENMQKIFMGSSSINIILTNDKLFKFITK